MSDLYRLPVGSDPPRRLNAIVEIARGGQSKYEYDHEAGLFRLQFYQLGLSLFANLAERFSDQFGVATDAADLVDHEPLDLCGRDRR